MCVSIGYAELLPYESKKLYIASEMRVWPRQLGRMIVPTWSTEQLVFQHLGISPQRYSEHSNIVKLNSRNHTSRM